MAASGKSTNPVKVSLSILPDQRKIIQAACRKSSAVALIDSKVDAALITDTAAEAIRCAESGQYALLLNPFFANEDERRRMAVSQRVMPLQTARFTPSLLQIQKSLLDGHLGIPGLLRIHDWRPKAKAKQSSMPIWLDVATWLFDDLPRTVYAVERPGVLQAHLGFAGGGMAIIDVDSITGKSAYFSLSLIGSNGAAYSDDHDNSHLILSEEGVTSCANSQLEPDLRKGLVAFSAAVRDNIQLNGHWDAVESILKLHAGVVQSATDRQVAMIGGV